jgi:hypothetical protein
MLPPAETGFGAPNLISIAGLPSFLLCIRSGTSNVAFTLCEAWQVQGTADAVRAVPQDVGVDHRRGDVAVAEKLLNCPDVVAPLEPVRGEGVPEGVARHAFVHARSITALTARWTNVSCR